MHSGPFGCLTKLGAKRDELVQKFVPRSCVGIFRNERTQSTPFGPKLMFWCISYHSGPFGCLTKLGGKRADLVQKFVPRRCVGIFCNECTRSTPFDPKLMFRCILYNSGAFGTVWLPYKTRWKMGRTSAKLRATKSLGIFHNERTQSTQLDHNLTFWCVSYHLGASGTVWLLYETRCKTGRTSAKSSCHEVASEYFTTNAPDPPHWTLN